MKGRSTGSFSAVFSFLCLWLLSGCAVRSEVAGGVVGQAAPRESSGYTAVLLGPFETAGDTEDDIKVERGFGAALGMESSASIEGVIAECRRSAIRYLEGTQAFGYVGDLGAEAPSPTALIVEVIFTRGLKGTLSD